MIWKLLTCAMVSFFLFTMGLLRANWEEACFDIYKARILVTEIAQGKPVEIPSKEEDWD